MGTEATVLGLLKKQPMEVDTAAQSIFMTRNKWAGRYRREETVLTWVGLCAARTPHISVAVVRYVTVALFEVDCISDSEYLLTAGTCG